MDKPISPIHQGVVIFAKNKVKVSAFYRSTLDLLPFEEAASHDVLRGHGMGKRIEFGHAAQEVKAGA